MQAARNLRAYAPAAHLYDALYQGALGKDYAAEAFHIAKIIREQHGDSAALLDVACGTGLHLSFMPSTFRLAGIDVEPAFVEIAQARVPKASIQCGRMEELTVDEKFDAITCLFSAIGHLPDVEALQATCRRFAAALVPSGMAIIEPWILPENWIEGFRQIVVIDDDRMKGARTAMTSRVGNHTTIHYAFAVSDESGSRAFTETHVCTLFTDGEYRTALESAGFDVVREESKLFGRGLYIARRTPAAN